jgi:hypothetical protein
MATKKAKAHPFTPSQHLDKARENENLARALFVLKAPCCDWTITLFFYSALHYIYSKLPVKHIQVDHFALQREIAQNFPKIYKLFNSLKDKSEDMRYYPHRAQMAKNDRSLCKKQFEKLEKIKKELKC